MAQINNLKLTTMKKLLSLTLTLFFSIAANAQFLVDSLGNIGVKAGDSIVKSTLSVKTVGDKDYDVYVLSDKPNGVFINNTHNSSANSYGLRVYKTSNHRNASSTAYGIYSEVNNNVGPGNSTVYGLFGQVGKGRLAFGTFGNILSANNTSGAGICGAIDCAVPNIAGRYAGYFHGTVYATDTIYAPCFYVPTTSNVDPEPLPEPAAEPTTAYINGEISNTSILNNLIQVKAIKYTAPTPLSDATNATTYTTTAEPVKYAIDAATLMEQFPGAVVTNAEGDTCIDYLSIIPVLLQAIKELKAEITTLKSNDNGMLVPFATSKPIGTTDATSINVDAGHVASLSQNTPNPFSEATTIAFTLPSSVSDAMICIYDMNGTQLEQISITERGSSSIQIDGYKLNAGMYLYSLIADGKLIDTKRMVLTK